MSSLSNGVGPSQGGYSTPTYPGYVGSNWKEMGPFLVLREVNGVLLNGCILRG